MTDIAGQAGFDTGRLVRRAANVLRENWPTFLLLSLFLGGLPLAALTYLSTRLGDGTAASIDPNAWGVWGASFIVAMFCGLLLNAALIHGALRRLNGHPVAIRDSLGAAFNQLHVLLALGLLTGLATALGYVLVIIPGVILSVAWSMTVPIRIAERTGVLQSMARSRELTRGMRGQIFGLMAVYTIAKVVAGWLVGLLTSALDSASFQILASTLVETLAALVASVGLASIYCELRWTKEGTPTEDLAAVFD
ncbi:hypothetical protein ASD89_19490 [Caulobacter sp. Root656]|nr:hypothetical protein ASD89_19490 [Caulobacter sp. Root656]